MDKTGDMYIHQANPVALLLHDTRLLLAQYDRHAERGPMQMTVEERRRWLAEAELVLRELVGICTKQAPPIPSRVGADLVLQAGGLTTLAQRRKWAAQVRHALADLERRLCDASPGLRAGYTDKAAWNLLMRRGGRPVTYKTEGHPPIKPTGIAPPEGSPKRRRGQT